MNILESSKLWERLALFVLIITLLVIGPANIWDKNISHDYPYGFYAQDAFIFTSYQWWLSESGNWKLLAPSLSRGFTDVIQSQPSLLEVLGVLVAQATGIPVYSSIYVVIMLLTTLSVCTMYFTIRLWNTKIAILSLPLNLILFSQIFITSFTWGNWPFYAGSAMLILFIWCIARLHQRGVQDKKLIILGAIIMMTIAFGHTSEYIFGIWFIGFILIIDILSKRFSLAQWKKTTAMVCGSVLLAAYYLVIFAGTFLHDYEPQYYTPATPGLSQFVSLTIIPLWLVLLVVLGLIIGIIFMNKQRVVQAGLFFLLVGFTNYIGTGKRGLETRYMWPITLSVFLGIALYTLIIKYVPSRFSSRATCALSIGLTIFFANTFLVPMGGPGLLSQESWNAMRWIATETPQHATVLFMYGDAYNQAGTLFNSERWTDVILLEDFIAMAQSGKLRREIKTERLFDHTNALPYRKGIFSFGFHQTENNIQARGTSDICDYDFYVFDTVSRIQGAKEFNLAIANKLKEHDFIVAYENSGSLVLHNSHVGGECIGA